MQQRDGSLTFYIKHEAPKGGKRANWIPAPAGPFFMAGSFYGPKALLIDGSYKIPECKRVPRQKQGGEITFHPINLPAGSGDQAPPFLMRRK